jgi:adenosylhomocysteinase
MPVLTALERQFQTTRPLDGVRVASAGRLTKERAYLVLVLKRAGARLLVADEPEPLHDAGGIRRALGAVDYYDPRQPVLERLAEFEPQLLLDNGHLTVTAMTHPEELPAVAGGTLHSRNAELLVRRAIAEGRELRFPLIGLASSPLKEQIETRHGTGQSTLAAIVNATGRQLAGAVVAIVGYGAVGRGLASYFRGAHARVVIIERSAAAGVTAIYDGMQLAPIDTALPIADFVITATGQPGVIRDWHLDLLKDGCVLANVGRQPEIRVDDLRARARSERDYGGGVVEYELGSRRVVLLAGGGQVNHLCGEGNASDVMDLSLALHVLCLQALWEEPDRYEAGIAPVDAGFTERVAEIKLHTLGVSRSAPDR